MFRPNKHGAHIRNSEPLRERKILKATTSSSEKLLGMFAPIFLSPQGTTFYHFRFDLGRVNSRQVGDATKANATRRTKYGTFRNCAPLAQTSYLV